MKATVLGASGFIGRNIARYLQNKGYDVALPRRDQLPTLEGELGHVFYCIGMTGNFREKPLATVEAHAGLLASLLERIDYSSFLYFSSTRIYAKASGPAETSEDALVKVRPSIDTTYDLSKMLGESLCLSMEKPSVRVVRLSNVYGPDQSPNTFLGSLLRELVANGKAVIRESSDSSKDYVSIADVADAAEKIARNGRQRIYNVASGVPISHSEIAEAVSREGYTCSFGESGDCRTFPRINIANIQEEFEFSPRNLLEDLPSLLRKIRDNSA